MWWPEQIAFKFWGRSDQQSTKTAFISITLAVDTPQTALLVNDCTYCKYYKYIKTKSLKMNQSVQQMF